MSLPKVKKTVSVLKKAVYREKTLKPFTYYSRAAS